MANDLSLDKINDILRNIGRMIGDALEVPRRRKQRQPCLDESGFVGHRRDQVVNDLAVVSIDVVIEPADVASETGVEVDKRIDALANHLDREFGHSLEF